VIITFSRPGGMDGMEMCSSNTRVGDQSWVFLRVRGRQISAEIFRMMSAGTELNVRRQPFQNSDFQCLQQLQGLPWDCHTLENTGKTEGSWVIAVGDSSMNIRVIRGSMNGEYHFSSEETGR
jgi:hypothetical protein